MFNFGFGDVIDRFEKHFGDGLTKVLMGVIAVSLVTFCLVYVVNNAAYPFILWLGAIVSGNPQLQEMREGVNWVANAIAFTIMLAGVVTVVRARTAAKRAAEVFEEAEVTLASVEKLDKQMMADFEADKAFMARAEEDVRKLQEDAAKAVARANELSDKADKIIRAASAAGLEGGD